jgi:hypothetical protein
MVAHRRVEQTCSFPGHAWVLGDTASLPYGASPYEAVQLALAATPSCAYGCDRLHRGTLGRMGVRRLCSAPLSGVASPPGASRSAPHAGPGLLVALARHVAARRGARTALFRRLVLERPGGIRH